MTTIPVVDLDGSNESLAQELFNAATASGFVFVKCNDATGLTGSDVRSMFELNRAFFESPRDVKEPCSIHSNKSGSNRGWLGMHTETLDPAKQKKGDFKEAFNFSPNPPHQTLSGPLAAKQEALFSFQRKCHELCQKILERFATALDIPRDWFAVRHDLSKGPTGSILRLLYYPSLIRLRSRTDGSAPAADSDSPWQEYDEEVDVRAGAHSDYGSVTLLFQQRGQPGLEILTGDGTWASVPVDPLGDGCDLPILVNIGDLLSYWTNGLLRSTVHRVIFPKTSSSQEQSQDRYSMAYFCHPLDDAELVPVPSKLVEERSGTDEAKDELSKVRALGGGQKIMTAKDHLNARLRATYDIKS